MTVLIENLCKTFGSHKALDHVVRPEELMFNAFLLKEKEKNIY